MNAEDMKKLLEGVKQGDIDIEAALKQLRDLPFKDIGHTKIDMHRELRSGYAEVIYCPGKTINQIKDIIACMLERSDNNILATKATVEAFRAVKTICDNAEYNSTARIVTIRRKKLKIPKTYIAVVSAGTSDIPVAEEAAFTAEELGNRVERTFDVGVAGIHRLMEKLDLIRGARVIVVVAGMEGALASVVGGLVDKPIIAVPTSIGYGANFGGISALLGMLTSCANGVSIVNIDNGFGAGYSASMINKL